MKKLLMLVGAASFLFLPVLAQEDGGNGQGQMQVWTFAHIDSDGDGMLTQGEFGTALYRALAGDDESGLGEAEYEQALELLGLELSERPFDDVDVNDDDTVSDDQEFIPGVATAVFMEWDENTDSALSFEEFRRGTFATIDANADDVIDAQELTPFAGWFGLDDAEQVAGGGGAGELTADNFMQDENWLPGNAEDGEEGEEGDDPVDGADGAGEEGAGDDGAAGAEDGAADGADDGGAEAGDDGVADGAADDAADDGAGEDGAGAGADGAAGDADDGAGADDENGAGNDDETSDDDQDSSAAGGGGAGSDAGDGGDDGAAY